LILIAAAIGLFNLLGVIQGWDRSAADESREMVVVVWLLVVGTILIAPFFEEIVFRGFLYGAFRSSYGIVFSTVATMVISSYFHWGLFMISPFGMLCGTILGIFLCWVRERTGNTWVCILCHAAYNATVTRQWMLVLVAIAVVFLFENRNKQCESEGS
jgi:membrane protease YdiL (CAAX protease family)